MDQWTGNDSKDASKDLKPGETLIETNCKQERCGI